MRGGSTARLTITPCDGSIALIEENGISSSRAKTSKTTATASFHSCFAVLDDYVVRLICPAMGAWQVPLLASADEDCAGDMSNVEPC
jgi:hypothetical protein